MTTETHEDYWKRQLKEQVEALVLECSRFEMAAAENHRLWQAQKAENERLQAEINYIRDWCIEEGYTLVVRMMDRNEGNEDD